MAVVALRRIAFQVSRIYCSFRRLSNLIVNICKRSRRFFEEGIHGFVEAQSAKFHLIFQLFDVGSSAARPAVDVNPENMRHWHSVGNHKVQQPDLESLEAQSLLVKHDFFFAALCPSTLITNDEEKLNFIAITLSLNYTTLDNWKGKRKRQSCVKELQSYGIAHAHADTAARNNQFRYIVSETHCMDSRLPRHSRKSSAT